MSFSERSAAELSPNRIAEALLAARGRGAALFDLTLSNPTLAGIPYAPAVGDALARAAAVLEYVPEPLGLESARRAVVELWHERGVETSADCIVLTASTSEAYAYAFKLLCDPGDDLLVPAPSYPLFEHLARVEGVRLVPYRLGYDGAWFLDGDAIVRARTPRSRGIIVVSPNNPTGSYLKRAELALLARLDLPVLSDEVFGEYPLAPDPGRARSALETPGSLVIALDGLSKAAALPQLKLAWMTLAGAAPVVREAMARLELIADTFLSPSTLVQRALPALVGSRRVAADAIRARLVTNVTRIRALAEGSPVSLLPVEGGWYAVLRLPATRTDEDWTLRLLEAGVVVQPGYFFDFDQAAHVVLSLITPEPALAEGVRRLVALVGRG